MPIDFIKIIIFHRITITKKHAAVTSQTYVVVIWCQNQKQPIVPCHIGLEALTSLTDTIAIYACTSRYIHAFVPWGCLHVRPLVTRQLIYWSLALTLMWAALKCKLHCFTPFCNVFPCFSLGNDRRQC